MRILKYFENFLNQSQDEKAYTKMFSFRQGEGCLHLNYEAGGSVNKDLQNFDKYEIEQIEILLKPEFEKNSISDFNRLIFSKDDFSLKIFKDSDDYYYVKYCKYCKEKTRYGEQSQYFECDYKDGLINLISDIKIGKFDYYYSSKFILVGTKTNLLRDMQERYQTETFGDETYYYDNGYHFGTLYKQGRFLELRHDGSLDENGRRKK